MLARMRSKGNPLVLLVGMQTGAATVENSMEGPQKLKVELPYDPAIVLGIYPKDTDVVKRRAISTPMFIAALSTIAKLCKGPRCPSMDEWRKKMWFIYTRNITQPSERMNISHLHRHGGTWRVLC